MTTEARTEAGRALLDVVRAATLDPAIHTLLSPGGKPELVALVSIELLERETAAIESEARAAALREVAELREAAKEYVETRDHDDIEGHEAVLTYAAAEWRAFERLRRAILTETTGASE